MYQDRFFHVLRLTGDFDKLGFAHVARKPNPSTRVHPRSQAKPIDASASAQRRDGRADVLQRWTGSVGCSEQTEAQAMCCERMHVTFIARNPNPCYASVFAKRSDGRTCAAAMDGDTWAAVNGRKYKRVVDFASLGRDSNLCVLQRWATPEGLL